MNDMAEGLMPMIKLGPRLKRGTLLDQSFGNRRVCVENNLSVI